MTHETEKVFFGAGDGDTHGRFHIAIETNGTVVRGIVTADNADKAANAAKTHVSDMFCRVKSITKLPDGIDIAKPGANSPVVNFIIYETRPLNTRLDEDLKLLCKNRTKANLCEPDECEDCPINAVLEMLTSEN